MDFDLNQWLTHVQTLPYFQRRMEIARKISPNLTRFLYKYKAIDETIPASVDHLRDLLVRSRLWLSSPIDFNDPFDMSGRIVVDGTVKERHERVKALLKAHGLSYKERERKRKAIMRTPTADLESKFDSIYRKNMTETGIFSFAGDPKNILMWSHYARDHTGICIQFERARDFKILSEAIPVEYSPEYPVVNWVNGFQGSLRNVLLRKHEAWSYEREHRIVRPGEARSYLRFSPQAIVGVILGCRATTAGRGIVESLLEERGQAGMPPVRLYTAQKHSSKYRIVVCRAQSA